MSFLNTFGVVANTSSYVDGTTSDNKWVYVAKLVSSTTGSDDFFIWSDGTWTSLNNVSKVDKFLDNTIVKFILKSGRFTLGTESEGEVIQNSLIQIAPSVSDTIYYGNQYKFTIRGASSQVFGIYTPAGFQDAFLIPMPLNNFWTVYGGKCELYENMSKQALITGITPGSKCVGKITSSTTGCVYTQLQHYGNFNCVGTGGTVVKACTGNTIGACANGYTCQLAGKSYHCVLTPPKPGPPGPTPTPTPPGPPPSPTPPSKRKHLELYGVLFAIGLVILIGLFLVFLYAFHRHHKHTGTGT